MIPILSASYPYTGNGLGGLSDCIEYTVTHEVNGEYEFSMKYPITGEHYNELAINYFVTAIPDNLTPAQPFRIYRITKPLNGVVTVYARHISYDMSGIVVEPFSAGSLTEAVAVLPTKCTPASPVTIQTDRTVATGMTLSEPRTLWKLLGGQAGSFLDVYGGEWDFNGLTATLKTRLGSDRGVEIRYGKNMTALEQDATIEATYAGVYPYWYDEESGTVVILPEKYVNVSGALVSGRVLLLDLSGDFDDAPTVAQLRARAEQYIAANSVGSAKTSWKVSFQSLEDENRALESVMLGDTIKVKYSTLGVDATSRVVKVEFDGLKERYKTVTIGRVKQNLAAIIVGNNQETQEKIDASAKSAYERAVDAATESIRNGAGTFRLIYNGDNLQEIVSLDNADIALAESVWRWNNGGFGHSADGYNGTYTLALLPDGSINAAVITTGTLNANIIRAGILQDALGKNSWNLATGAFTITKGSINVETNSSSYDVIAMNNSAEVAGATHDFTNKMSPVGNTVKEEIQNGATLTAQYQASSIRLTNSASVDTSPAFSVSSQSGRVTTSGSFNIEQNGATMISLGGANNKLYFYDSDGYMRVTLDLTDGLRFFNTNGTVSAEYPAHYKSRESFGTITPYNSRGTVDSGGFYRVGSQCNINFLFTASYSATNTPRITGMSAVPQFTSPLQAVDLSTHEPVGCYVNTAGNIYLKTTVSGHQYAIGGTFII